MATSRPSAEAASQDEASLIAGLRAGDDAAFEKLVSLHGGRMLAVARRYLRSEHDAQDAVQDAFLQAFKAIARFQGNASLSTWLHRITVNAALMKLRAQRHEPGAASRPIDDLLPSYYEDGHRIDPRPAWRETGDELTQRRETRDIVLSCIDRLPEDYRTILLLRDIEELSTEETAERLGVSQALVKTRLHRARQALRTLLERQFARDDI